MAWGVDGNLARRPMTPGIESQVHLEATRPTTIISPRTTTTIGTWNVRTMYMIQEKSLHVGSTAMTGPGPWEGAYWWPLPQTGLQAMMMMYMIKEQKC